MPGPKGKNVTSSPVSGSLFGIDDWFDAFNIEVESTWPEELLQSRFICLNCLKIFRSGRVISLQVLPGFEDGPEFLLRWLNIFEHPPKQRGLSRTPKLALLEFFGR